MHRNCVYIRFVHGGGVYLELELHALKCGGGLDAPDTVRLEQTMYISEKMTGAAGWFTIVA